MQQVFGKCGWVVAGTVASIDEKSCANEDMMFLELSKQSSGDLDLTLVPQCAIQYVIKLETKFVKS